MILMNYSCTVGQVSINTFRETVKEIRQFKLIKKLQKKAEATNVAQAESVLREELLQGCSDSGGLITELVILMAQQIALLELADKARELYAIAADFSDFLAFDAVGGEGF